MQKVLEMRFRNVEDKLVTIRVNDPKEPYDPVQISSVMDTLIEKNVFETSGGDIIEKVGARVVSRAVEDIELDS